MLFLCPRHRRTLIARPRPELLDLWLHWMHEAALCSAMDEGRRAVSFSGCGFDLMCALAARPGVHQKTVTTRLSLSAIYAARQLAAMQETDKAALVLSTAFSRLGMCLGDKVQAGWSRECMSVLLDERRQEAFFSRYLNIPLAPPAEARPVLLRRLH